VCVNPCVVFGTGDVHGSSTTVVRRFLLGRIPAYVNGAINIVDVEDVARGHLLADRKGGVGERYILGNRNYTLDRLRSGASCKDVFNAYNEFMRQNARPREARIHCHGQGYDMVERPFIRGDEPMPLRENMNIACHPNYVTERVFATFCDNYIVHTTGVERIHAYREALIEV
jgi:nucleoside-diphosphate-sugar epimerase